MNKDIEFLMSPGLWKKTDKIVAAILITGLLLFVGFTAGTYVTIKSIANIAVGFVDVELVKQAVWMWENNIRENFPSKLEDAFNDSDERE